jgi:pyruvate/2-oxoglutarate dehydrogenase complex dihydrolipoamide acyltransferase (E2) component
VSQSTPNDHPFAERAIAAAPEIVELTVPELGLSVDVATIVAWAKQVGDRVAADEPICVLAVNQLQFQVHSTAYGELRRVFAAPGTSVRSGDSLAEIGTPAPEPKPGGPASGATPATPYPQPRTVETDPEPAFHVIEPPDVDEPPVVDERSVAEDEPEAPRRPEPEPIAQPDPDAPPPPPSGDVDWSWRHSPS